MTDRSSRFQIMTHSDHARQRVRSLMITVTLLLASGTVSHAQTPATGAPAPPVDFSQLSRAEVGSAVQLTDEQKAVVLQTIVERDAAVAAAEETARPEIIATYNAKLKASLTPDQLRLFNTFFTGKLLRFNFRNQKWAEVLDWIAKEADLSLVMETPPPGTFNYSDSRDYTTTESIDLLNGWLLTKGFALVRRERMLMVLDLKAGLPEGTIPRISPEELETRGRYEFVSVLLPLEGRAAEVVLLEVKPLLGSYGKAEALAQTRQLLVFDTASNLRVIEQIVKKIPVPETPALPAVIEKPVLTVYPVMHANPEQAGEVLKTIVVGTVVVDIKAGQISVNAVPTEQEKAKIIIGQLESNQGPDLQPKLQLYSVQVSDAEQMLATLKLVAPDGQYRIDPVSGKLIAWASEKDQAHIAESLEMIQAEQPQGGGRQLQVYALKNADPVALSTILLTVVPTARVTVNAPTRSLVAFGTLTDHEAIRALIQQLEQQAETAGTAKVLKTYPAAGTLSTNMVTLMATAVPSAQVLADTANQRLLIMATADQHTQIEVLLQSLVSAETGGRVLVIHDAERVDTTSVTALLTTVTPQAAVTIDAIHKRLLVVASEDDQKKVTSVLEQVQTSEENSLRPLKSYPLQPKMTSATITTLLATLVPKAGVTADEPNRRLLIAATEKEHILIEQVIAQVQQEAVGIQPLLKFYSLTKLAGPTSLPVLQTIAPLAKITFQPEGKRFSIIATPDDHAAIASTLQQLEMNAADLQRSLKFYDVSSIGGADARALLTTTYTDVSFVATADGMKVMAWVSADQDQQILATLEQLTKEQPFESTRTMELYSITDLGPSASTVLAAAVPGAKISAGARPDQLAIVATAVEHESVTKTLEQLAEGAGVLQRDLKFFDVSNIGATEARTLLATTFADVTFVATAEGNKLMAWVSADQEERIAATLEKVASEKPFESTRTMELYSITDLGPSASTVLAQAVPRAVITAGARADQLAIVATAADHEKLKTVLSQLQGSKTTPAAKELVVYPIKGITPTSVLQVLQPLVDADVQLTVDPAGQQLFVRAFADKQQQIKTAVEQITATLAARGERSTKTYLIGAPNADEAQEVLTALFPDAKIVTDADRKMIVATATAEQHTTIGEIAEQMKGNPLDGDRPVPAVYSLKNTSATEVQTLLQSMYSRFDNVRLSVNEKTGRLIVLARKEQQEAVRVLIEELDGQTAPAVKQELAIFRLKPQMDGLAVQQALQPLLPKSAQVTADRIGRQLFVSAPAADMVAVRELVQQMLDSSTQSEGLETRSYRLRPFEADEAQEVLTRLFADATFVTDVSQEILVATATVPQHETIAKVVEQMTSVAPIQNAPQAIAYPLRSADGENAVDVFDAMFRRSDNVRVSFDSGTRSLIAVARPDQHAIIKALVEQLEPAEGASDPRSLEVYALQGMDGLTAVEVAEGVLRSVDPAATVSWEKTSKQLIVSTTPAGQQEVTRAFARFQDSDPREMDVIQLRMLSASAAQNAIEGLYGDSFTKDDSYPVIQADEDSQQLLVRGSKKQLQDIRTLLIKMGETGLSATGTTIGEGNLNLRVIPIQGDVEPTLKKIQDLWPRVRNNPIRVLRPGAEVTPVDPQSPQGPAVPDERAVPDASKAGQFSVPAESLHVDEPVSPEDKSAAPQAVIDSPAGAAEATAAALAQADKLPADIVIIPGADHITIASDDVDALDQLESILRATTSRAPGAIASRNRDFSVYQLRNAGAEEVAETLESIYESRAGMLAFGSVVIVPEARMNALIVYGGRSDRDRIEQLLEILDTEKLPDSGRIFKTQVIPVKHADAEKLESVIKGIYRTEMTAGGTRRAIEIPAGIDSSVANVLRQINAASSAPLLTIEVQSETNSLVIKAPQNLIDELSELVTQLDESAATNRARGVTLVPLKQTNTRRVMRILNDVLD